FEIDVHEAAPAVLFKAEAIDVRQQIDVSDGDDQIQDALREAISRMPERVPFTNDEEVDLKSITARTDIDDQIVEELFPHEIAIEILVGELSSPGAPISLANWKAENSDNDELTMEEWLLFSSVQLQNEGFDITYLEDQIHGG